MDYEATKYDANFVEDGILLCQQNGRDLWINLVLKNDTLFLFDYHSGQLLKALPITEDFDHGKFMEQGPDVNLQWAHNRKADIRLRTRDQAQKLRIEMMLATAYASAVQGIPIQNTDDLQNEFESDSSDNASTIPDSPKPPSKVTHSMSTEDARATIRPGTVGSMRNILGNELSFNVGYKPFNIAGARPAIPRPMEVPPDPPERCKPEPEPQSESESEPEPEPDYNTSNDTEDENDYAPVQVIVDGRNDYATTMEVAKPWMMSGCPSRQQAEKLVNNQMNGTFFVRSREGIDSTVFPYAVTMAYDSKPVHIQIQRTKDGGLVFAPYKAGEKSFSNLDELIQHYQDNKFYFATQGIQRCVSLRRNE